ncbi:MAG: SUF system Fe-S cluster assembly protein [Sphingomonas taxi]|uniref:SUF system Fe-S cluster assembly protein n=1 Tax=Sphingomonas taxi TaxID=1549858 RepID=A0A2W5PFK8_9SPHN|nr:MAG: SUF system Fe-S cluster assembly protein [Sphingomonas taxi]
MSEAISSEAVEAVDKPPRAKVSDAVDDAPASGGGRQRDYLSGFLAQQPTGDVAHEPGGALYEAVIDALKDIFDPEIPVNIYDLGLIYGVDVTADGHAAVTMTLTTPHCPVAESMPGEVEMRVAAVPGIAFADVNLVWDPPWDPQKMSDDARLELGML